MADYTARVRRNDDSGKTIYVSLGTDKAAGGGWDVHDPDSDQAYLDQQMTAGGVLDDGDTQYWVDATIDDGFGTGSTAGKAVLVVHTGTVGVSADFSGVTVLATKAVGPNDAPMLKTTLDIIESLRDDHSAIGKGNIYWVDPVNGDTHANGNRGGRDDPYSLVQDCHDNAVTDYGHDVIFLVPGNTGAQTVLDEQVTLSKNYVFIRGPGLGFLWKSTSNGDVITVTGAGVELSGFELQTHTTGSGNGFVLSGDFAQVRHVVISNTRGDGIQINDCSRTLIENVRMFQTGQSGSGDGIVLDGTNSTTQLTRIFDCEIYDTQGEGILLQGANVDNSIIMHNVIHGGTAWGVNIGSGVSATFVAENWFGNNTSGSVTDSGANSDVERNDDWLDSATANDIDGKTFQQAMRYVASAMAGKITGAGTGTETATGLDGSTDRVQYTVDSSGNRTAVSYDP